MPRSTRLIKKRKFLGNKYKKVGISENVSRPSPSLTSDAEPTITNDSVDDCNLRPSSSSSKTKVTPSMSLYDHNDDFEYSIIDLKTLESTLQGVAVCNVCHSKLKIDKQHISGLACKLVIQCESCDKIETMNNCETVESTQVLEEKPTTLFDLNIRLVYGMRAIGKGRAAAEKFCGIMNLNPPVNLYHVHEKFLGSASESVCKKSMSEAVKDAVNVNDGSTDLAVALDGSWQKRGHTSLNGILSATSLDNGKVVDIEILSKYCNCSCKFLSIGPHEQKCLSNFHGTSGAMEVAGAVQIFQRSLSTHNVRYLQYLGDGDTKAFMDVSAMKPYGEDVEIKKIECVGHVQKRMGTRLRNLKLKTKKLPDGTRLGGKNRLTNAAILKLQSYYGLSIRRNCNKTVRELVRGVWSTFYHVTASNERTYRHSLCPKDDKTWCKFNLAQLQKKPYNHNDHFHLHENIMNFIKPIFIDLSKPELLEKCVAGKTQNVNESLNNVIWSYVPKKVFVQLNTLKFGVYEAVSTFNDGHISKWKLLNEIGLQPGKHFVNAMKLLDRRRVAQAEKALQETEKKIRKHQHLLKRRLEDQFEEAEVDDPSYGAGLY